MNLEGCVVCAIPEWSLCYLYYGTVDNLSEEDKRMCDDFLSRYSIVGPVEEDQTPYFTKYPEYGLACDVVDYYCEVKNK